MAASPAHTQSAVEVPGSDNRVSRRGALLGGAAAAAFFALAACGEVSDDGSGKAAKSAGPWKFVDDRKRTASQDSVPAKIVAQISAAAALWELGIKPAGIFGEAKGSKVLHGNVDTGSVPWIGKTWGEFNLEKFLSLAPDLLVAPMQIKEELWYVPEEAVAKIEKQCPTVGISHLAVPVDQVINRFAELAKSLGADLTAPAIAKARKDFDAAAKAVGDAAKAKSGLKVAFVSATKDQFYYANPAVFSDLLFLQRQGIDFIIPKVPKDEPHFEFLSWEQAGKYQPDVFLYDKRNEAFFTTNLKKYPTLANLPAVRAGQLTAWNPETPSAWSTFAPALNDLAQALSSFKPGIAG